MEVTLHKVKIGRGGDVEQRIRERRKRGIGRGIGEEIRRVQAVARNRIRQLERGRRRKRWEVEAEGGEELRKGGECGARKLSSKFE